MIFKRNNLSRLYDEYRKSISVAEELRKAYESIPYENIKGRIDIVKKTLDYYYRSFDSLLSFISRFSPNATKILRGRLTSFKKSSAEQLNRDYRQLFKTSHIELSEDSIIKLTNDTIDNIMMFLDVYEIFFNIVIITISETLKRTKGKLPVELNEYVTDKLEKVDKSYAKLYKGAWDAFHSENPDRYRHLSASLRKLLIKLLGNGRSEMKEKIKDISGSDTVSDFIVSLAEAVEKLYETLSKGVHQEIDEETALLSLRIMESIIEYLDNKGRLG